MTHHLHGWRPDRPDHRDLHLRASWLHGLLLPKRCDLSSGKLPRIEDQGQLGSCTCNSATSAQEYLAIKAGRNPVELSRLFAYYAVRVWVEHTLPGDDAGAQIRDVMKALALYGVCAECLWPYDVAAFASKPSATAMGEASRRKLTVYQRCTTLTAIKSSIASGYPVVGGFSCPASIESAVTAKTGIVALPEPDEEIVGGHAVLFVGFDDGTKLLKFENSWGTAWGDHGFGYLPYAYVTRKLASDFWMLKAATLVP